MYRSVLVLDSSALLVLGVWDWSWALEIGTSAKARLTTRRVLKMFAVRLETGFILPFLIETTNQMSTRWRDVSFAKTSGCEIARPEMYKPSYKKVVRVGGLKCDHVRNLPRQKRRMTIRKGDWRICI
jgi:hypothetical protein